MDPLKLKLIELLTRDIKVSIDPTNGEVVIRTGLYQWSEGEWRDGPDPLFDEVVYSDA